MNPALGVRELPCLRNDLVWAVNAVASTEPESWNYRASESETIPTLILPDRPELKGEPLQFFRGWIPTEYIQGSSKGFERGLHLHLHIPQAPHL